jgi:hypothetical protein
METINQQTSNCENLENKNIENLGVEDTLRTLFSPQEIYRVKEKYHLPSEPSDNFQVGFHEMLNDFEVKLFAAKVSYKLKNISEIGIDVRPEITGCLDGYNLESKKIQKRIQHQENNHQKIYQNLVNLDQKQSENKQKIFDEILGKKFATDIINESIYKMYACSKKTQKDSEFFKTRDRFLQFYQHQLCPNNNKEKINELDPYNLVLREQIAIKHHLDYVGEFHDGWAVVKKDGKQNHINIQGHFLSDQWWESCERFVNGLAKIEIKYRENNFINTEGELLLSKSVNLAHNFCEGYAVIGKYTTGNGYSFNYIDTQGNPVYDSSFWSAEDFSDGWALTSKRKDNYNFISPSGQHLNSEAFNSASPFSGGYAPVKRNSSWDIIDRNGNTISSSLRYDYINSFNEGYARAI